jgi:hypothetical protein
MTKNLKGSFRRSVHGQVIMGSAALWVIERLEKSGMTFDVWLAKGAKLKDIGINRASARAELQPRIPEAHRWYSEHGEGRQFGSWDEYWTGILSNRVYYFVRKHNGFGKVERRLGEFPGRLENGRLVVREIPVVPEPEAAILIEDGQEQRSEDSGIAGQACEGDGKISGFPPHAEADEALEESAIEGRQGEQRQEEIGRD